MVEKQCFSDNLWRGLADFKTSQFEWLWKSFRALRFPTSELRFLNFALQLALWLRPSYCHIPCCEEELSPPTSTPWGAYRWNHPLPDELPGEHVGGATLSQINSLDSIQVEPPLPDQLPG